MIVNPRCICWLLLLNPLTIIKKLKLSIMKSVKFITLIALSSMIMSFNVLPGMQFSQRNEFTNAESSALVWKSEEIDLGKIPQGKPVTVQFDFTNTGKDPVIIASVATSCGCTIADYSKKPIPENEKSTITATYNAANPGAFTKAITVTFSNNEIKILNIKGTVI